MGGTVTPDVSAFNVRFAWFPTRLPQVAAHRGEDQRLVLEVEQLRHARSEHRRFTPQVFEQPVQLLPGSSLEVRRSHILSDETVQFRPQYEVNEDAIGHLTRTPAQLQLGHHDVLHGAKAGLHDTAQLAKKLPSSRDCVRLANALRQPAQERQVLSKGDRQVVSKTWMWHRTRASTRFRVC